MNIKKFDEALQEASNIINFLNNNIKDYNKNDDELNKMIDKKIEQLMEHRKLIDKYTHENASLDGYQKVKLTKKSLSDGVVYCPTCTNEINIYRETHCSECFTRLDVTNFIDEL